MTETAFEKLLDESLTTLNFEQGSTYFWSDSRFNF
jgi:hypothetical protein